MGELGDLEDPVSVGDDAVIESSGTSNFPGPVSLNFQSYIRNFINSSSVSEESEYVDFVISESSSDSSSESDNKAGCDLSSFLIGSPELFLPN